MTEPGILHTKHDLQTNASRYGLRLLSLYRILLGLLLWTIFYLELGDQLGSLYPRLFLATSGIYVLLGVFWLLLLHSRTLNFHGLTIIQLILDILFTVTMVHASGGLNSGLGISLVVSVAGASLLLNSHTGLALAAFATLVILAEQAYTHVTLGSTAIHYTQSGTLAIALFITSGLMILLNRRAQESEQLATQRSIDLKNLTRLNDYIIQQMQNGIIVIDMQYCIRLFNKAVTLQLGLNNTHINQPLSETVPQLYVRLLLWQQDNTKPMRIKEPGSPLELQPYFIKIGTEHITGILIFLEDSSAYTEEFQALKLASLGRLAGSIAHEIRNPLSAIQHAAQLIAEDVALNKANQRLIDIIHQQSSRMNRIIENVMQLSRREQILPEHINLHTWFNSFSDEFCAHYELPHERISINIQPDKLSVIVDASQLHQIIWNLFSNSYKYGTNPQGQVFIYVDGFINSNNDLIQINIRDDGCGIDPQMREHVFEPFYSSSSNSSGLGLYIVHELCEFNHIDIDYICHSELQAGYFQLIFADNQADKT